MSALACAGAALSTAAETRASIAAFSAAAPGAELPRGWRRVSFARTDSGDVALAAEEGVTVLRIHAAAASGAAAFPLSADPALIPMLAWRWKVERALERATWGTRAGDDFAARVYVSFDVPVRSLPFLAQARIRMARFLYGEDVPTAAICYVWANRVAVGTSAWSPYTDRVRVVVVESGDANAGKWQAQSRDVAADFRAAFGDWKGPVPRVTGVAVASDTDQTGESVTAWYGDLRLGARP